MNMDGRLKEDRKISYYGDKLLNYEENVSNHISKEFYKDHGCKIREEALEVTQKRNSLKVMTTKHCILRELGKCKKLYAQNSEPLFLISKNLKLRLDFDCKKCEMSVFTI